MKKSFSVAEAMITLLIVSVALAAMAPIMSRQIKNNSAVTQKLQLPSGMISFFNKPCSAADGGWSDVPDAWKGRYPRIAGNYKVCDIKGENANGACSQGQISSKTISYGGLRGDAARKITGGFRLVGTYYDSWGVYEQIKELSEWAGHARYLDEIANLTFDSAKVVPVDDENRVKEVGLYMCVKN